LLIVPPFAEEMNKCRRMMALLARGAAEHGVLSLIPDLFGTGDSDGDFRDASWAAWRSDLVGAGRWLESQGVRALDILAVRTGALLCSAALPELLSVSQVRQLMFWQPVTSGARYMQQFLRMRLAADAIVPEGRQGETGADLRSLLAAEGFLEVAGYTISRELHDDITRSDLTGGSCTGSRRIHWFEVVDSGSDGASPAAQRAIEALRRAGAAVEVSLVVGEPFWSTPEIATVPGLIQASLSSLGVDSRP
jgi:exosortase A-associated hydrolase 2